MFQTVYPAKIILFGEYSVLKGSSALAIPLRLFSGKWSEDSAHKNNILRTDLQRFIQFLVELKETDSRFLDFNTDGLAAAWERGLAFVSDIPTGYGAGSSGALVAATYDIFCEKKTSDTAELKKIMSAMEGFFHGSSSGIDPLVCYLKEAILIRGQEIRPYSMSQGFLSQNSSFFLIDTGICRQAEPLVQWFQRQCESKKFEEKCVLELALFNDSAITHLENKSEIGLFESFSNVSNFQIENMSQLIPSEFLPVWKRGLDGAEYRIKICGAGGGGFLLGFTKNLKDLKNQLQGINWLPLDL